MIKLVQGSIFDSKCDLLVVPCNNKGGISNSLQRNLALNKLPALTESLSLGDVYFKEINGEINITFVVGFAASVEADVNKSTPEVVQRIAKTIRDYAKTNSIKEINIPLLGAGAGQLSNTESYLALKNIFENCDDINLNIFALTREIFKNLQSLSSPDSRAVLIKVPRVFISYTGRDKDNAKWTIGLADLLRKNGVDARIDVYHLKPGYDLPQWMTNELIMADKVLLICDEHYIEKSDFRKGGVGWETMIIQGDMLSQGDNKNKYIAIIRKENVDKGLPIYMKSKYALQFTSQEIVEEDFQQLVLHIFDCDMEPELGNIPEYVLMKIRKARKAIT